jgi:hypothetical protein
VALVETQPIPVTDIVAEVRQRWRAEYEANTNERISANLAQEILNAPPSDLPQTKQEITAAQQHALNEFNKAEWRRHELSKRQSLSDDEVISWLKDTDNFDGTFPDRAG